jgi:hypothetical protein
MLLNHKEALNFIIENPDYVVPLTIARIEDVHSILIKNLDVERNNLISKRSMMVTKEQQESSVMQYLLLTNIAQYPSELLMQLNIKKQC